MSTATTTAITTSRKSQANQPAKPKWGVIDYSVAVAAGDSGLPAVKSPEALQTILASRFSDVPAVISCDADERIAQRACGELRSWRGQIEKRRKELKADAIEYGRQVDLHAAAWTKVLDEIQKPIEDARTAFRTAEQRRKAEEERKKAEEERRRQEELAAAARREAEAKLAAEQEARRAAQAELEALRAEAERQKAELEALKASLAPPPQPAIREEQPAVLHVEPAQPLDFAPPLAEQLGPVVDTALPVEASCVVSTADTDREKLLALGESILAAIEACESQLSKPASKTLAKKLAKSVTLFMSAVQTIDS